MEQILIQAHCQTHANECPLVVSKSNDTQRGLYLEEKNVGSTANDDDKSTVFKDFPEGGLKAWSVVFGSWCCMAATFGVVNSVGFLQAWLTSHQLKDESPGKVSWIFSVLLFLYFFGGVQIGPIFDTYGLKFVLIPGCIGTSLSIFILSVCEKYYQFMLGFAILGGVSATCVFTPAVATVGHWFYKRRGLATGLAASGGAVGGTVFPLIMIKLMPTLGYAWTIRIVGFIVLTLCTIGALTLRARLPKSTGSKATVDLQAFRDIRFTLATLGIFFIEWGLFIPVTYISSYALYNGINETFAYQLVAILNAGSVLGRALPGYTADRLGRYNVMIFTAFMCAVMCIALWFPASGKTGAIIGFAVLFGFWSGTGICLTPVCISQICRTEDYGKRYGTCYFFVSFGTLTGLPIAGAIQSRQHGSYQGLILFSSISYMIAIVFFIMVRIVGGGWRFKKVY